MEVLLLWMGLKKAFLGVWRGRIRKMIPVDGIPVDIDPSGSEGGEVGGEEKVDGAVQRCGNTAIPRQMAQLIIDHGDPSKQIVF